MPFLYPLHTCSRYILFLIFICVSSVAAEDSGDEFSNNLFSDLAPLLTLFGEQVAKQFLGQSMGWADNLIFSMAPLGIITAVVAAIRVGGPTWLRAIIGRAKESQGVAELELMSSTSASVCELWNGQTVVRVLGSPEIIELVYLEKGPEAQGQNESDAPSVGVYSFEESKSCPSESNPLYRQKRKRRHTSSDCGYSNEYELLGMSSPDIDMNGSADVEDRIPNPCAPNISLNARGETASQSELWSVAVLGTVIQSFVIVYWGLITKYEPWLSTAKFRKGGRLAPEYAFPMTTVGTVAVVMGMLICSHVVDAATVEEKWKAKEDEEGKVKFAWLQKGQVVNDEHFDSYAIFCLNNKQTIMTSRVKKDLKGFQSLVLLGTIISISGFVAQFMGLRGMHWSATIAQLVATAVMSTLRAIIRRHLTRNPAAKKITKNFELDCMAREIANCGRFSIPSGLLEGLNFAQYDPLLPVPDGPGKRLIDTRERLRDISGWTSNFHKEMSALCDAIERTMEYISDPSNHMTQVEKFQSVPELSNEAPSLIQRELDLAEFNWPLIVGVKKIGQDSETFEKIEFNLKRRKPREAGELWGKWKVDRSKIEAAYSLCMLDFHEQEMRSLYQRKYRSGLRQREDLESQESTLRILGFSGTDISLPYARCLYDWWIARETNCIEIKSTADGLKENDIPHFRVIGSLSAPLDGSDSALAVISNTPLEKLCAQHIFSVFLSSASEFISSMPGKMAVRRYNKRTIGSFGITHSSVEKIAQIVQEVGLANLEEAYMSIIPPLAVAGKLPSIIEAQRDILSITRHSGNLALAHEELKNDMFFWLSYTCHITARSHTRTRKDLICYMQAANGYFSAAEACVDILGKRDPRSRTAVRELLRAIKIVVFKAEALQFSLPENDLPEVRTWFLNIHQWLQRSLPRMPQLTDPFNIALLKIVNLHRDVLGCWAVSSDKNLAVQHIVVPSTLNDWDMEQRHLKQTWEHLEANFMANYDRKQWSEALSLALNKGLDAVTELLLESTPDAITLDVSMDYNITELLSYSGPSTTLDADKCLLGEFAMRSASYTFDVDFIDEKGQTALCRAAYSNKYDTAEALLETHGADINKKDDNGRSPLFIAAVLGHHNIFRLLYERGADINAYYENGNTCLHAIASKDYLDLLDIVLYPGQDVRRIEIDSTNDFGETPLHFAAREGYLTMVDSLLDMGASADKANNIGQTPLAYAAASGHVNVINSLKARGASINTIDQQGSSIMQIATFHGHTHTVAVLLLQGALPQWRCVQVAADLGNDGIVELVLSYLLLPEPLLIMELPQQKFSKLFKAKKHAEFLQQPTRSSLLRTAIRKKLSIDQIKFFLDLDADPCHRDSENNSALSLAVAQENCDLLFLLLANSSPIITTQDIEVPVRIAVEKGDERTLDILLQAGPVEDNDLIALSTRLGSFPITEKLLALGLRLESQKVLELLRFSAVEGSAEIFWILRRIVPTLLEIAKKESTLHLAAELGKDDIISALLSIGVDVNSRSHEWTALQVAAKAGHLSTVKLLVQSGAWINSKNPYQWTALSLARARGFGEIEAYINSLDRTDPSFNWENSNESPRSPGVEKEYDPDDPWNSIFELDTGPYLVNDQQAKLSFQLSGAVDAYPMQKFELPIIDDTESRSNQLIHPLQPLELTDEPGPVDRPITPLSSSSDTDHIHISSQTPPVNDAFTLTNVE